MDPVPMLTCRTYTSIPAPSTLFRYRYCTFLDQCSFYGLFELGFDTGFLGFKKEKFGLVPCCLFLFGACIRDLLLCGDNFALGKASF
jgi:hypothetical protein